MATFTVRQGDLAPPIAVTLRDDHGAAVDLTDATVWLHLVNAASDEEHLYAEAVVFDPPGGRVGYQWEPSTTDVVGEFNAMWEVVHQDGGRPFYDEPDPPTVEVVDDLAI